MAGTDPIAIVALSADDAPGGLALSAEAHWNQNEADWRFFLKQGTVFGMRDKDGRLIASAALLPYSPGCAWISMVLVTARWRRQGLATRLVDACLEAATKQGLTSWLDATPAGAAVYGPLGFTPTLQLRRMRLDNLARSEAAPSPPPCNIGIEELAARDIVAMGFNRRHLLTELSLRAGSRLLSSGDAVTLVRDGRKARHIGPLFADSPDQALALVEAIVRSETGPLLIDTIYEQEAFLKGLTGSGWIIERPFQRMRLGHAVAPAAALLFAAAGPEYG